jgi:hypothetical protein
MGNLTTIDNKEVLPSTTLKLEIYWDQVSGAFRVDGPAIQNQVIAFGMLDMARKTISGFHDQQAKTGGIVGASAMPNLRM